MPNELDVPHFYHAMVDNYRRSQKLPERVTDRMIYARLIESSGMMPNDIEEAVGDLIEETLDIA